MVFEIYRDIKGEYRWRLIADNGRIVAESGEGYKRKDSLIKTLNSIRREFATWNIETKEN